MSGPNAGDRFGPDGETEEQHTITDAEVYLRAELDGLHAEIGKLKTAPAKASQRKVVVACVALMSSAVVSIVLVVLGDADSNAVMMGYGAIVTTALGIFAAGNAAEHAVRSRP